MGKGMASKLWIQRKRRKGEKAQVINLILYKVELRPQSIKEDPEHNYSWLWTKWLSPKIRKANTRGKSKGMSQ